MIPASIAVNSIAKLAYSVRTVAGKRPRIFAVGREVRVLAVQPDRSRALVTTCLKSQPVWGSTFEVKELQ